MDKSSNRQAGRAGIVLHSYKGDKIECMVRLDFPTTNNEVEYEVLVVGLDLAKAARATDMVLYCDSQAVMSQVNGNYECNGEWMNKYLEQMKKRTNSSEVFSNPKGGEQASQPSCQDYISKVYAYP